MWPHIQGCLWYWLPAVRRQLKQDGTAALGTPAWQGAEMLALGGSCAHATPSVVHNPIKGHTPTSTQPPELQVHTGSKAHGWYRCLHGNVPVKVHPLALMHVHLGHMCLLLCLAVHVPVYMQTGLQGCAICAKEWVVWQRGIPVQVSSTPGTHMGPVSAVSSGSGVGWGGVGGMTVHWHVCILPQSSLVGSGVQDGIRGPGFPCTLQQVRLLYMCCLGWLVLRAAIAFCDACNGVTAVHVYHSRTARTAAHCSLVAARWLPNSKTAKLSPVALQLGTGVREQGDGGPGADGWPAQACMDTCLAAPPVLCSRLCSCTRHAL
jgi:hypothetical protein